MTFRTLPIRLLISFGLVFPVLSPVFALDASAPTIVQFTLENGLKVVLAPSATAKNVAVVVQYDVGSANETPGHSGFAHLFEHLMFEGTKSIPNFDAVASSIGAQNNAFTQDDGTVFHLTGPRAGLPVMLRLDADRMANLANSVTQEDLDNQREVVLNEMRQNVLVTLMTMPQLGRLLI
jgi:zinc protease